MAFTAAAGQQKKTVRNGRRTHPAQGMVEFGLIMPILLLVIYGVFEVGRVVFIYSIVASATREALRHGSSTGVEVLGGVPRFRDCAGIRAAAQTVDFLGVIDESGVAITYDHGPGTAVFESCPPNNPNGFVSGDRIVVQVYANFVPIIPIIPWAPWTITSTGSRTLLLDVRVAGTIQPPQLATYTPSRTWTPSATPTATFTPSLSPTITETSIYTLTPSQTPTITQTPTRTGTATASPLPSDTPLPSATPTPTATEFVCNVRHSGPITSGESVTWTIFNNHTIPVEAKFLIVYWDSGGNRLLQRVVLNGAQIYYGNTINTPMLFSGLWSLPGAEVPPGISRLTLTFSKATGNIRVLLNFVSPRCVTLDSLLLSQVQP